MDEMLDRNRCSCRIYSTYSSKIPNIRETSQWKFDVNSGIDLSNTFVNYAQTLIAVVLIVVNIIGFGVITRHHQGVKRPY